SHGDTVRDRDRVVLDRGSAGRADTGLYLLREAAQVIIARHNLDPGVRNADQRASEIVIGKSHRLQHRAGWRPAGPVGQRMTLVLRWIRHPVSSRLSSKARKVASILEASWRR